MPRKQSQHTQPLTHSQTHTTTGDNAATARLDCNVSHNRQQALATFAFSLQHQQRTGHSVWTLVNYRPVPGHPTLSHCPCHSAPDTHLQASKPPWHQRLFSLSHLLHSPRHWGQPVDAPVEVAAKRAR